MQKHARKRRLMSCCVTRLIVLLLLLPQLAGAGPYDGRYRPDHPDADRWDCVTIGKAGGALAIANDAFIGIGSRCALQNGRRLRGMDASLYDAICRGKNAPWRTRLMIMNTQMGITIVETGGKVVALQRCE